MVGVQHPKSITNLRSARTLVTQLIDYPPKPRIRQLLVPVRFKKMFGLTAHSVSLSRLIGLKTAERTFFGTAFLAAEKVCHVGGLLTTDAR